MMGRRCAARTMWVASALVLATALTACQTTGSRGDGKSFRLAQDDGVVRVTDPKGRRFICTGAGDYAAFEKGATDALFGRRAPDVAAIANDAGYTCRPA